MSAYKEFKNEELFSTVIKTAPLTSYKSGALGVENNFSRYQNSSISMQGGVRSRSDVKQSDHQTSGLSIYPLDELDTRSIDRVTFVSGSYPSTGSIKFYNVYDDNRTESATVKDEKTFKLIDSLFRYYESVNNNYTTRSLDFYSLFFQPSTIGSTTAVATSGTDCDIPSITTAMTVEASVKWLPKDLYSTSSVYTLFEQKNRVKFWLNSNSGTLFISDTPGSTVVSSSLNAVSASWNHVAFAIGNGTASFYVNGQSAGQSIFTASLTSSNVYNPVIGATLSESSTSRHSELYTSFYDGLYGSVREVRVWNVARTSAQISSSYDRTLFSLSSSDNLKLYYEFREGPTQLSATFDSSNSNFTGTLRNFQEATPVAPIWQPCDDQNFITYKRYTDEQTNVMSVIESPSMFYGRQIATGSFKLVYNTFNKHMQQYTIVDDGKGCLYLSGSTTSKLSPAEERKGVVWRKVGNIFYTEGIAVITDKSMLDLHNEISYTSSLTVQSQTTTFVRQPHVSLSFNGDYRTSSKIFMCRMGEGEFNASNNDTFTTLEHEDSVETLYKRVDRKNTTYITAVGLYDAERKLVAVAKIAQPIRKREKDKINIRLRFDL